MNDKPSTICLLFFQWDVEQEGVGWTLLIFLFPEIIQSAHYCPEPCHLTPRACFRPAGQNRQLACVVIYLFAQREMAASASSWLARTYQSVLVDPGMVRGPGGWNPLICAGMCQGVLQTCIKLLSSRVRRRASWVLSSRHGVGEVGITPAPATAASVAAAARASLPRSTGHLARNRATHHAHTLR